MCGPAAVPIMMAVSTIAQGYAAKQKGNYDNQVAQYNARIADNQATQTLNKGTEAENIQRQRTAQLTSMQRAQAGASNVSLAAGGSASALVQDTAMLGEADALRIKTNYGLEAQSLNDKATLLRSQGDAAKSMGNSAFSNSILMAGGTFAGTSGVADKWFTSGSAAKVLPSASPSPYSLSSGGSSFGLKP